MTTRPAILEGGEFDMRLLSITDDVPPLRIETGGPLGDVYRLLTDDDGHPSTDILGKLRYRVITPITHQPINTWRGFPEGSVVQHHTGARPGYNLG